RSGSASIWNAERRAFEPPAQPNPLERRTLAEIGPLRLARVASERSERATGAERGRGAPASDGVGGAGGAKPPGVIEAALRVADVQGRLSWMPIDLSSGRFPFDMVRSIAVIGNVVYVG